MTKFSWLRRLYQTIAFLYCSAKKGDVLIWPISDLDDAATFHSHNHSTPSIHWVRTCTA